MALTFTDEFNNIIDKFLDGYDLAVNAGAGSGKTTLMIELGYEADYEFPDATVFYNTLNKANAEEVKKKFKLKYPARNVDARTMHSLAYQSMSRGIHAPLMKKLNSHSSLKRYEYNKVLCVRGEESILSSTGHLFKMNISRQISLALEMVNNFCSSGDKEILQKHVPYVDALQERSKWKSGHEQLAQLLIPIANRAWSDITSAKGQLRFSHDYYLKIWQLSSPVIGKPGDIILYDEAQDVKPCVADILLNQKDRQLVFVGDNYQNIYRFIGSGSILRDLSKKKANVACLPLSKSWRFGENTAELANCVLRYIGEEDFLISGNEKVDDKVQLLTDYSFKDVDAVVFRSNAALIECLIEQVADKVKVAAVVNTSHIFDVCDDISLMQMGKKAKKVVELKDFVSLYDLQKALDDTEVTLGDKSLYKIVLQRGPATIKEAVESAVTVKDADLVLSTIHKAKGLEWDNVAVIFDNHMPTLKANVTKNEYGEQFFGEDLDALMILYVAVTRAKYNVFVEHRVLSALGKTDVDDVNVNRIAFDHLVRYLYADALPIVNGRAIDVPESWNALQRSWRFSKDIDKDVPRQIFRLKGQIALLPDDLSREVFTSVGGTMSGLEFQSVSAEMLSDPSAVAKDKFTNSDTFQPVPEVNKVDDKMQQIEDLLDEMPDFALDALVSKRKGVL